ncbi:MAG: AfsR/SARP family transcriptional regulator [Trebonia sp.]
MTRDDGIARIHAPQQRALLVALAIQAGDMIPADVLAEVVWGPALPGSWRETLRNLIRRLRTALGTDSIRLARSSPGYLLDIAPGDVDMHAFESLHKSGMTAAQGNDWNLASDTLARALALWRGVPFTDVPSALLRDTHLPYLEDQLLDVQVTRIEAIMRLTAGSSGGVIPELRQLAARHPFNERFRWLLMLALARSGRKAEALTVFRDAWDYSTAELGVEPGQTLRQLNQRVLAGDESLLYEWPGWGDTRAIGPRYVP